MKANVGATVKRGTEYAVAQESRKMKEVTEVLVTYGLSGVVVRIEAKSLGHLDNIATVIRQMAEIQQTNKLVGAQ